MVMGAQVAAACRPVELGKRERKVVNYNERMRIAEDSDDDYDVNKELVDKQHVCLIVATPLSLKKKVKCVHTGESDRRCCLILVKKDYIPCV